MTTGRRHSTVLCHRLMEGVAQVWRHNWQQLLSVYALARNVLRVTRILMWLVLSILRWNLFQPFHMIKCVPVSPQSATTSLL